MAYNSNDRSERLLQGRRFTTDNLTLVQEAFTDVFDLGATEIYTDDGLIPTASSQLTFNSAADDQKIVSGSVVDPTLNPDLPILRYHFRHKMRPAADAEREVYYFTTSEPSSPTNEAGSDQLIETDQETNFISPKYIVAADSSKNTESNPPGYKVIVYKDASATAGGVTAGAADPADYVFDFKTGVLSWKQNKPSNTQYVYITVYQYIGRTLRSQIDDGSIGGGSSGDFTSAGISGSWQGALGNSATDVVSSGLANSQIAGLAAGIVSGSAQIVAGLPNNVVSSSAQTIANLPAGVVSGSTQTIANLVGSTILSGSGLANDITAITSSLTINKGVVFTNANGQLQQDADGKFTYDSSDNRLKVDNLETTTFTASFVTSSIIQASGSNVLGDEAAVDVQTLIGSTVMSGSAAVSGSMFVSGSLTFNLIDCGTF